MKLDKYDNLYGSQGHCPRISEGARLHLVGTPSFGYICLI